MMDWLSQAIVGHLVGDYLFQDDLMARLKKSRSSICALHCALWTLFVIIFAGWPGLGATLFLFGTHFAIDRWTFVARWMKWRSQEDFMKPPLGPWSVIVVDNVWHIVTLYFVALTQNG